MSATSRSEPRGRFVALAGRFLAETEGQIAILFAFALGASAVAVGGGIDLARAYTARQKLSHVATLACQYARRPSVIQTIAPSYSGANGASTYQSRVDSYITAALSTQAVGWTQTNGNAFTFTVGGPAAVNLAVNVPTAFINVVQIRQMPVSASAHCYDTSSGVDQTVPDGTSPYLVKEGFEVSSCTGTCYAFYSPTGTGTPRTTPQNTAPASPGYTGANGAGWYVMGHCVEIDAAGVIRAAVAEGGRSAELDCDNGSGSAGNSSISTRVYMPTGNYELRYFYASRIDYPDYNPAYVCGSAAADVSWATSNRSSGGPVANVRRSNQINVYLDLNSSGSPPTHTTIDGSQTLAGSNLIDVCVHSQNWIERSVRIYVTTPGHYWLSFAADGQNDSYGGQLDGIRLCPETCPGALQDNFPPAWLAANNGGVNKVLFQDNFDAPTYAANHHGIANTNGNMNQSLGTSGASSGWPNQNASGWATAPYNQTIYMTTGSSSGAQSVQLDASTPGSTNRYAGRPFVLDPGYYRLDYSYISNASFPTLTGVYCGATPSAANLSGLSGSGTATIRLLGANLALNRDTNIVGAFMFHDNLVSSPIGGGALNSQTSFDNPNGTTTTTPTVAPNAVSLTSYNAAQPNPLLDICGYATSWQSRTASIRISKPGTYWLTFAALGSADGVGGVVDSARLTALGSLSMPSPPTGAVAIPVPNPQPGSTTSYTGYFIVADPLTLPAPLQ